MMLDKALTAIGQYSMLAHGDTVVVGLSGGADSVCLLSLMCSLREEYDLRLLAAHINHGIRGSEAERDERFCKELCEKMNVPFRVLHADIPKLSRESGEGVEECGRRVRYEFFSSLAGEGGKIATAHNMNDAAETLIFNLTRGSSLRGAGSIAPVRDNIIRPLITTPRSEVEEYLHKAGLSFVIDSTNLENVYTRNKIRNTVLPVLTEINPSAVGALAGFAARAREDEALLNKLAEAELERICRDGELDAAEFSALDISLRRRAARLYISRFTDADVLNKHIEDFIDFALGEAELQSAGALRLVNRQGVIKPYCRDAEQFAIKIKNVPCEIEYPYGRVGIKQCSEKDLQNLNKELLEMCVDCDKIGDNLELRSRREGDSIELVKRSVTKSLKKLFNEDRIPADRRNTVPVLACEKGVVWVGGYGVSREYRVDKNTEKALIITMMQGETKMYLMENDIERVLLTQDKLKKIVAELGEQISRDYEGKELILVSVLKGSVVFMGDLMRAITIPCYIDFMSVSSYGNETKSTGVVKIIKDLDTNVIDGSNLLIVEDILDSGRTLSYLKDILARRNPESIKICTLLDKPDRRVVDLKADYVGAVIPDAFVVGYGLDYAEKYRNLPFVGVLKPSVYENE